MVAPVRERGLKSYGTTYSIKYTAVAPVRERGLKFLDLGWGADDAVYSRSREGAWIEISSMMIPSVLLPSLP